MTDTPTETRSAVVEHDFAHPPEKLWRASTQPHLISEWLIQNDFAPRVGHRFKLTGDWGGVLDCQVLEVEPSHTLLFVGFRPRRSGLRAEECRHLTRSRH